MSRRYGWLLIIFLAAAFLRLAFLTEAPPGLTHDEADHGLDAWGVVNGDRPIYFTVGYGREPLYDYTTAVLMSFLGPSYLAGRLTSAYFSLFLIAATYAWVRRAFDDKTALLAAAGLAVSFWAVITGRQALRSITLPAIFALSAAFYWNAIKQASPVSNKTIQDRAPRFYKHPWFSYCVAGILLGLTLYTYIPARILWIIFPIFLFFVAFTDRHWFSKIWPGTALLLILALAVALPMILFLASNPEAELRLDQLNEPITNAARGDFNLLAKNVASGLGILTFKGDGLWRYNIAGRPLLSLIMSILFMIGLVIAVWWLINGIRRRTVRNRAGAAFFALIWLFFGLVPVLITGAELSTPRAIAVQAVIFILPALALITLQGTKILGKKMTTALTVLLFTILSVQTFRQYFVTWAKEPEVRVQYESSLVMTLDYLDRSDNHLTAISTTTPEEFHSPAIAYLNLGQEADELRWFNGQHLLLIPDSPQSQVIFSGFAPLNPFLEPYFEATIADVVPALSTDIDQPLTVYRPNVSDIESQWKQLFSQEYPLTELNDGPIHFGSALELIGYDIQTPQVAPGEDARVATLWRVLSPLDDAVLFTQLLGSDGLPITQADRLDAPGQYWQEGDYFIQLHQFPVPGELEAGQYPLIIGLYTRDDLQRIEVSIDSQKIGDHVQLAPLIIIDEG